MAFAGAGVADQNDRFAGVDPGSFAQGGQGGRVDGGGGGQVEVLQAFDAGEAGLEQTAGPPSAVALVDLGGEHLGQIGPMSQAFFGCGVGQRPGLGAHGGQMQHPTGGADGGLGGRFAQGHGGGHDALPAARRLSYPLRRGTGRTSRAPVPMGTTGAAGRRGWMRRASMATTSGSTLPIANAASMASVTTAAGVRRCNSSTAINARVPAPSPRRRRASIQNRSWTGPNAPLARAWARAVEPGMAPGLRTRISR